MTREQKVKTGLRDCYLPKHHANVARQLSDWLQYSVSCSLKKVKFERVLDI
jgi:hypothetical protein